MVSVSLLVNYRVCAVYKRDILSCQTLDDGSVIVEIYMDTKRKSITKSPEPDSDSNRWQMCIVHARQDKYYMMQWKTYNTKYLV